MRGKGVDVRFAGRSRSVMRMLSVVCLLVCVTGFLTVTGTGCAHKVQYLHESEKIVHMRKDEPAPHDGWLLSDGHLARLYDLLERKLEDDDMGGE